MVNITKREHIIIIIFTVLIVIIGSYIIYTNEREQSPIQITTNSNENNYNNNEANKNLDSDDNNIETILVHISGAVNSPGVYEFEKGDRVFDAIEKAGGPTEDSWLDRINLARRIRDEEQIHVPFKTNQEGDATIVQKVNNLNGLRINLNNATSSELESLPGIGPAYAKRIIEYRENIGCFEKPEDIMNVSGIGRATYENIKDQISTF